MKDYVKELESNMEDKGRVIQTITTKFYTPYVSMADAIADKFGETRTAVLQRVIEQGVYQLFLSFDDSRRGELAKMADDKTTEFMLSKNASIRSHGVLGDFENEWTDWRMMEYESEINKRVLEITEKEPDIEFSEAVHLAHLDWKNGRSE